MKIGLQASHEQFAPGVLLELAKLADTAGFDFMLSSDHVAPWSLRQDNSGFAWAWLGAALQATSLSFSVVSVPGWRYHPAVLAQAIATLCAMYPGRFFPCLGSGEALNEHITGAPWPEKSERNRVLEESVSIMRRLWRGETVTHFGAVKVDEATLYTQPPEAPLVHGAALSLETAAWLGGWADGLITVAGEGLRERIQAFAENGGRGKPVIVKADFAYGHTHEQAVEGGYDQWRYSFLPSETLGTLRTPQEFDAASAKISKQTVESGLKVITSIDELQEWTVQFAALDIDTLVLHNVARNQRQFVEDFAALD